MRISRQARILGFGALSTALAAWLVINIFFRDWLYRGDGEFESEGFWPLVNYSLNLPSFELSDSLRAEWDLSGYTSTGDRSHLALWLRGPEPISFHLLDAIVEVSVTSSGREVFRRRSALNNHYLRMVEEGKGSWPSDSEWRMNYSYTDERLNGSVVPFTSNEEPLPVREARYWDIISLPTRNLVVTVTATNVPPELDLEGQLLLGSGWK